MKLAPECAKHFDSCMLLSYNVNNFSQIKENDLSKSWKCYLIRGKKRYDGDGDYNCKPMENNRGWWYLSPYEESFIFLEDIKKICRRDIDSDFEKLPEKFKWKLNKQPHLTNYVVMIRKRNFDSYAKIQNSKNYRRYIKSGNKNWVNLTLFKEAAFLKTAAEILRIPEGKDFLEYFSLI